MKSSLRPIRRTPRGPLFVLLALASIPLAVGASAMAGCSSTSDATLTDAAPDVVDPGLIVVDSGKGASDASKEAGTLDAGVLFDGRAPANACEAEEALATYCGDEGELQCGAPKFAAWCALSADTVNSAQRNAAIMKCSTPSNCDGDCRAACIYASYGGATLTANQTALVRDYCASCYPDDAIRCFDDATKFTSAAAVTDVFLAAWELSDPLTRAIHDECVERRGDGGVDASDAGDAGDASSEASADGAVSDAALDGSDASDGAADAGPEAAAAACARRFATCAGGLYIDALPNCP